MGSYPEEFKEALNAAAYEVVRQPTQVELDKICAYAQKMGFLIIEELSDLRVVSVHEVTIAVARRFLVGQ